MDIVPPKKPFTEDQFKYNTDRRIKGALGGFDKSMMIDLIQKDLTKIQESGAMDYNDAVSFIKERADELKNKKIFSKQSGEQRFGGFLPDEAATTENLVTDEE